jgi:hypothetical protein
LRRESLLVPPSAALQRICKGSGVTVFRMERPDAHGALRSPWVIKKADISPRRPRERRRVERTLEHESRILSKLVHPNIIGFRAAQARRPPRAPEARAARPLSPPPLPIAEGTRRQPLPGAGVVRLLPVHHHTVQVGRGARAPGARVCAGGRGAPAV